MVTKGKSPVMASLLKAGGEVSEKVQQIKSVVTDETKSTLPISPPETVEKQEKVEEPTQTIQRRTRKASKKGLTLLFSKREKQDTESVKIPREYHAELKVLAGMTGIGIVEMLGNIIEDFFEENREAIDKFEEDFILNRKNK